LAICHLSVASVSRSTGRSAPAAAAYRAGRFAGVLVGPDGREHDYTRRSGVVSAEVLAPIGCEWAKDRQALWTAAEQAENRKDAKVAREVVVALPAELDADQRGELAMELARRLVNRHGVAIDVAVHLPCRRGDQRNHHAHLLATTRTVGPAGLGPKTRVGRG
jgi:ATP-dependent exoDNAse (exonuclease V) alpha subunit